MHSRLRPLLIAACLLAVACGLVGCSSSFFSQVYSRFDSDVRTSGSLRYNGYSSDGSTFTVKFDSVGHLPLEGILVYRCLDDVVYTWKDAGEVGQPFWSSNQASSLTKYRDGQSCYSRGALTIPTRPGGGVLEFRLRSVKDSSLSRYYESWKEVTIPAAPAPTPAPAPAPPSVVVFAHASPAGDEGTLLDARLSTGTGALSYAWSPTECAGTTYESGSGSVAAPTGTAGVAYGVSGDCTVTVTGTAGGSASATVSVTTSRGLHNGSFSFDGSAMATIHGVYGTSGDATRACVDLTGSGVYNHEVVLSGLGTPKTANVPLTALTSGMHVIGATLWTRGISGTDPDNLGCTNTGTAGAVQVIKDLYTVDSMGAARRGVRSSSFVAPSTLRFVPTKNISEGTFDPKSGVISGATMGGSFSWATPKSAKGVQRPDGATKLARGAYVMRSISMTTGPLVGKASTLLGNGTVLLRGADGTLACGTLAGSFDSSTLTLAGGTRSARTLAGNVTGQRVTYVFPKVPAAAARSGGVAGVLARALGWITGDQPAERAKKPSKKPKPVKAKPVKASGTASLQTAAKPTGLPAACKALVQYLPQ